MRLRIILIVLRRKIRRLLGNMGDKITKVPTYWAKIFVGTSSFIGMYKEQYERHRRKTHNEVLVLCSEYANEVGLCITVTPTEYIYSDDTDSLAGESGFIIGLINYPRFPAEPETIRWNALDLGKRLKEKLEQKRLSIMFPEETIMLGEHD